MEPVRFRADEILYAQSTLTPNCAASCAKAPLPASYAPRSFCRRSLLYAFAISTTSTNAKRLQRISLYTFWKFALSDGSVVRSDRADALSNLEATSVPVILATWGKELDLWLADDEFVLDKLQQNNEGWFSNRLDMNSVGAFGHSFGGAASTNLLGLDPRVKSA